MSRFNTVKADPTHEGGAGYARDTRTELFLLAVSNMVGENTFYEAGGQRDERYTCLIHSAATQDPLWTARFLKWLRGDGNMRTASLVGAAEFVKARLGADADGLSNKAVIDSVLLRADEPGELIAYWTSQHGRAIPKPVKRGVADAVQRLYTERALLKWDSSARDFRFGDVLELTHAAPSADWQGDLFGHAISRRHGRGEDVPESLAMLRAHAELMAWPVEQRRALFESGDAPGVLRAAGMTWESVAGWLQGPMTSNVWEALIPTMGYMALLRNLRNFDQAGVRDEVAAEVAGKLADSEEVARSRQLPMRFLSAYKAAPSLRWAWALEKALASSLANVPALPGRTLVLVDRSGSMFYDRVSRNSDLTRAEAAAVFGTAVALRAERADLVQFGSTAHSVPLNAGDSVLTVVKERFTDLGGTDTSGALRQFYRRHDRVIIVTDEQHSGRTSPAGVIPANVPLYTWNLAGYQFGHVPSGVRNLHTFGGLTDAAFRMVPLLEAGQRAIWPF